MSNMIEILEQWQKNILSTDKQVIALHEMFDCGECALITVFEKLQIAYTEAIAEKIGDDDATWLMWYWLDNDMGKGGLNGGYDGATKPITSLQELSELIVEGVRRGGI